MGERGARSVAVLLFLVVFAGMFAASVHAAGWTALVMGPLVVAVIVHHVTGVRAERACRRRRVHGEPAPVAVRAEVIEPSRVLPPAAGGQQ